MNFADKVWTIYASLSREDQFLVGGPPYTKHIAHNLQQYHLVQKNAIPNRQRFRFGYATCSGNKPIGYQETTILRNAKPNQYDRDWIKIDERISALHLKLIMVHPTYRKLGKAQHLLDITTTLAKKLSLPTIVDVTHNNTPMHSFLTKNGFDVQKEFRTPKSTTMYRFEL